MKENIIRVLGGLSENFKGYAGTDMMEDEILDSFAIMELIAQMEEIYQIEIDADDIVSENFKTVDSVLALVEKYVRTDK